MSQDHDALFRHTFSHPEHAASLLRSILAPELAAAIDWDRLALLPGTFVDEELRTRQADLLFTAPMHGVTTLIHLLIEHKSGSDRWTALQMLRYVVRIYDHWRQEHPDAQQLPPVLPIVVHHGEHAWSSPQQLADLIDLGQLTGVARQRLAAAQPQFTFGLEDLAATNEQQLRGRSADEVTRLVLLLLQCARRHRTLDPVAIIERWLDLFAATWHHPLGRLHVVALSPTCTGSSRRRRNASKPPPHSSTTNYEPWASHSQNVCSSRVGRRGSPRARPRAKPKARRRAKRNCCATC